ncbi:patatin-like phospholipase family protein [Ancylobacter novellus]|uniref:patatin-like phospholipase family protein n=1 Tax=Ancylobacter novellus TaxID=921 RepID=UPI001FCAC7C6|nr:patatin-like phospholipase family protein [Ancylobacter novellus]
MEAKSAPAVVEAAPVKPAPAKPVTGKPASAKSAAKPAAKPSVASAKPAAVAEAAVPPAPKPAASKARPAAKAATKPSSAKAEPASAKPSPAKPAPKKPAAKSSAKIPAAAKSTHDQAKAEAAAGALATPTGKGEVNRDTDHIEAVEAVKAAQPALKPINLALQGGGAHGAFTWGVLDRLLEDGRIAIEGISGTSAGAMNAAVLATGLARGGNEGGREALNRYWRDVSRDGRASPLQRTLLDRLMGNWSLNTNPAYVAVDVMSRFFSPYDLNPLNINPLMELIEEHVDFAALQSCRHVHVFVSATNVHTGKVRVFAKHELTAQAIMASACLPFMFQAVEIDGVPYWDGGYMGNPALFPFYNAVKTDDILLVQINPIIRRETPKTARDIQNRMNEITFNASLLAQLRAAEFVTRLLKHGKLNRKDDGVEGYRDLRIHRIDGAEKLIELDASTKMNAEWEFLLYLHAIGREAAENFLEKHFDSIGVRSTLDVHEELTRG